MSSDKILWDYEALLERLYSNLPERAKVQPIEIPEFQIIRTGPYTRITNFKQVCDRIRREPRICMRYLLKEIGARGAIDDSGALTIFLKVSRNTLRQLFKRFLETYVRCSTCGSYHTELRRQGKVWVIRCLACGAETPVRPI